MGHDPVGPSGTTRASPPECPTPPVHAPAGPRVAWCGRGPLSMCGARRREVAYATSRSSMARRMALTSPSPSGTSWEREAPARTHRPGVPAAPRPPREAPEGSDGWRHPDPGRRPGRPRSRARGCGSAPSWPVDGRRARPPRCASACCWPAASWSAGGWRPRDPAAGAAANSIRPSATVASTWSSASRTPSTASSMVCRVEIGTTKKVTRPPSPAPSAVAVTRTVSTRPHHHRQRRRGPWIAAPRGPHPRVRRGEPRDRARFTDVRPQATSAHTCPADRR